MLENLEDLGEITVSIEQLHDMLKDIAYSSNWKLGVYINHIHLVFDTVDFTVSAPYEGRDGQAPSYSFNLYFGGIVTASFSVDSFYCIKVIGSGNRAYTIELIDEFEEEN